MEVTPVKLAGIIGTTAPFLLLGTTAPAYPQEAKPAERAQGKQEAEQAKSSRRAEQKQEGQQAKSSQHAGQKQEGRQAKAS
jgi:hypothetical protein